MVLIALDYQISQHTHKVITRKGKNILIFSATVRYLLESGAEMAAGHTMQVGKTTFMKLRDPLDDEYYFRGTEPH